MRKTFLVFLIVLSLSLVLTGCFENCSNGSGDIIKSGEAIESGDKSESGEIIAIVNPIKDLSEYFTDNICLGIASITFDNEEATANKYCNDYEHITKLRFDNKTEYVDKFLIIPKDDTVSFDLCSVKITDEGTIEPEFELDKDIKEPIVFTCDDFESTMPQYGLRLKCNGFEDLITLSFSGYDGSLNLYGHESEVVDLTIYN